MWLTVLGLAGTGLVAGMFGAMLGLGGGIFLVPALTLLFGLPMRVAVGASLIGGLLLYSISSGWLLERLRIGLSGPDATSWLRSDNPLARLRSGEAAMGLGLLALALVPVITVSLILVDHLRDRRWKEAAVAASVVAIMALGTILGKKWG
jgi:hypothetical protein